MRILSFLLVPLSVLLLVACSGGSGDSSGSSNCNFSYNTSNATPTDVVQVNASSRSDYVYYTLSGLASTNPSTVFISDRSISDNWDIAFKRTGIILNDGISGPGSVEVTLAATQSDYFYDSSNNAITCAFQSATVDTEAEHFDQASASGVTFTAATKGQAIPHNGSDSWYTYNSTTHALTIHDDNYFIFKTGTNAYGRLRATKYEHRAYTFAFSHWESNAWTTEATHAITFSSTQQCYNFSNVINAASCSGSDWDVTFIREGHSNRVYLNSTVYGKGSVTVYGPTTDSGVNPTQIHSSAFQSDTASDALTTYPWYAYNLQSNNKIWPNYRVYLIKKDSTIYKMQVTGYYKKDGASGYISLKIKRMQ